MTSSASLISVILPTYNGSRYLAEAIDSCLAQTYQNWELIIVDDCSQDGTPEIIADYVARDSRIRTTRHASNKKLPAALNTGHAAARGAFLTWISDDNRFLPSALEELARYLEHHPRVGIVYAGCIMIDEQGGWMCDYPVQPISRLAYMNALHACFLYRRSVYEQIGGYDAQQFLAEDWDYWLRASLRFEIAPLHSTLYEYRWHNQSLTAGRRPEIRASIERTLRRHLPYLPQSSCQDLARGWTVCAAHAARRGDWVQAGRAYLKALRTAPGSSIGYVAKKLVQRLQPHRLAMPLPNGDWP